MQFVAIGCEPDGRPGQFEKYVAPVLEHAGAEVVVIDPGRTPECADPELAPRTGLTYKNQGRLVWTSYNVRSLAPAGVFVSRRPGWVREQVLEGVLSGLMDEQSQVPAAVRATLEHVDTLHRAFPGAVWLNDPEASARASFTPFQLQEAVKYFPIPEGIQTPCAEDAREWIDAQFGAGQRLVRKPATKLPLCNANGTPGVVPTTEIMPGEDQRLEDLRVCPMRFEQYFPGPSIRVVAVAASARREGQVFAGRIVPRPGKQRDRVRDPRYASPSGYTIELFDLPTGFRRPCLEFLADQGMLRADMDFQFSELDGSMVFLEMGDGQWGDMQSETRQPIGETLADLLLSGPARHR